MSGWKDMAVQSELAARRLLRAGFARSCASRAYYAVYAHVAGRMSVPAAPSTDRAGPSHAALPNLCESNLPGLSAWERRDLKSCARRLYRRRIEADYFPHAEVGPVEARASVMDMSLAIRILDRGEDRR